MKISNENYGIVVDAGSSGSRIQVYKWQDPNFTRMKSQDKDTLMSPPEIIQQTDWNFKTTPGISSFYNHVDDIWSEHFEKLVNFAIGIVPHEKQAQTPIFVLATAGMRLLPFQDQKEILNGICKSLKQNSPFLISSCSEHVSIIDGETEGVYGWLSLNYLMNKFNENKKDANEPEAIGFMDMGGASTQICFAPSSEEDKTKHKEDLAEVTLRTVEGNSFTKSIFTETWLGFGANQARKRYLNLLIDLTADNENNNEINDPCMPRGSGIEYEYNQKTHHIKGTGKYETCLRTIYPLLMKNLPCKDEPCLFNGIHGPKLDFKKDRFVGISEYWYTVNDIFHSGGEYNYELFNSQVRDYCESDWDKLLIKSEKGEFSNLDPEKFLKDACFKASWVINVLHEGFELPRLGIEIPEDELKDNESENKKISQVHVPFKSASSVDGKELSWTLGKILLYASSQISPKDDTVPSVGIIPSNISLGESNRISDALYFEDNTVESKSYSLYLIIFGLLLMLLFKTFRKQFHKSMNTLAKSDGFSKIEYYGQLTASKLKSKYFKDSLNYFSKYHFTSPEAQKFDSSLMEEGLRMSSEDSENRINLTSLRTRSNINLSDTIHKQGNDINRNYTSFINKPFTLPQRSVSYSHISSQESKR